MATHEQHAALDALIRRVQQATSRTWPAEGGEPQEGVKPSPELVTALAAAIAANDSGLDVEAALEGLQAAWEANASAWPARTTFEHADETHRFTPASESAPEPEPGLGEG